MRQGLIMLALALAGAGCGRGEARKEEVSPAATTRRVGALTFHEDDYGRALAEARRRGVPLFVDVWAPWCHTCLSLQAYVLSDPSMAPLADRFVWLSIDTEREKNKAFLDKFPIAAWPTLWVIDPKDERPATRWVGSLNLRELGDWLDDAAQAVRGGGGAEASAALLLAERAVAEGKEAEGVEKYRAALAAAGPGWPRRGRAVDGLVTALHGAKRHEECAETAKREGAGLAGTAAANVALYGLLCAKKLGDKAALAAATEALGRVARDEGQSMLADDRSSLFEELADAYRDQGDREGQRRAAADWSAFVDGQAGRAATPEARRVFDAHRMLAYLELGEHARALAMVEQSEREQPGDYNHAARAAKIHLEAGRPDEALKAIDRSLGLAYGPRRLRLFDLKARIFEKKGDAKQARAVADLRAKLAK